MADTDYADLSKLKSRLGVAGTEDDARLQAAITSASRQIDAFCGRVFYVDKVATTRVFQAWDSLSCDTDDISSTTGLVVKIDSSDDGSYATSLAIDTDFILTPHNSLVRGRPAERIEIVNTTGFPQTRRPAVQVTALFGHLLPDAVITATELQAKNLWKLTGAGMFGSMQLSPDGFPMKLPGLDYVAQDLLKSYRREVNA